jgi:hypothetical protein
MIAINKKSNKLFSIKGRSTFPVTWTAETLMGYLKIPNNFAEKERV